jgi:small redox-active disulfide protein 2
LSQTQILGKIGGLKTGSKEKKMEIKVLGPGCPKCKQTEQNVKEAVAETGIDATVEKVTDIMEIAGYGVFGTPSVVIDGEVKSVGKIPTKEDVKAWLEN